MSETEKLCHRWIVEYYCWRMLEQFQKSGTVDDWSTNRMVDEWRGVGNPENFGDRKTHGCRLLMHFMRKIAEAAKEMSNEMSDERQQDAAAQTVWEEALELLDYISNAFTRLEDGDLTDVQHCLRRYAVLAPLHKDDVATAKVNILTAGKVFRIGTVRYNWPMSAHASQAFSIAHCTDLEDLPTAVP